MSVWSFLGDIAETALNFVPGGSTVAKLIPGVSSIFSDADSAAKSKEQLANQKALMQYQNELNLQNWQTQQEFNNYANDLQHMKEAGINPLAFAGASPTSAVSGVSGGTAPDLMSLLNYQRDMKLAQSQLQLQRLDAEAKRYENKALKAEADARVAEAKEREADATARYNYNEQYNGPAPDNEHDWKTDEAGRWYYLDGDNKVYAVMSHPNTARIRDIKLSKEFQNLKNDSDRSKAESIKAEYDAKLSIIQESIAEYYGVDIAARKLDKLVADIAAVEANTAYTNAQKFQIEMDNEIWKSIGVDGRMAVKILQYILGFVKH